MSARIPTKQIIKLKFRGFPGPFAPYRPVAAQPNFLVIGALILFGLVAMVVMIWIFRYTLVAYPLFVGCGAALTYFYKRRWQRRLDRHDGLLCLQCAYPLEQAAAEGRCPECGHAYTHASTRWGWRVFCGRWSDDLDPPPPMPPKHEP